MKTRMRAEEVMRELDEIIPRLNDAYEAYLAVSVEWYDRCDRLQYYRKRGVVSDEEIKKYLREVGMNKSERSFNQRLKEYRAKRRKESAI